MGFEREIFNGIVSSLTLRQQDVHLWRESNVKRTVLPSTTTDRDGKTRNQLTDYLLGIKRESPALSWFAD